MRIRDRIVADALRASGWFESREVPKLVERWVHEMNDPADPPLHPGALAILREFGGLKVAQAGPGETVARGTFSFDPTVALREGERFAAYSEVVGSQLSPLGLSNGGQTFLAAAADGRILSLMDDAWIIGQDIEDGLVSLVRGRLGVEVHYSE